MVKINIFNGVFLFVIVLWNSVIDEFCMICEFFYFDFKDCFL